MIKTGWNGGSMWWCDECDVRSEHNHYVVSWTAGKAPAYCSRCVRAADVAWDVCMAIRRHLRHEPTWTASRVRELIAELKLPTSRFTANHIAAVLVQLISRHEVESCNR